MEWRGIEWLGVGGDNAPRLLITGLLVGIVLTVALPFRAAVLALLPRRSLFTDALLDQFGKRPSRRRCGSSSAPMSNAKPRMPSPAPFSTACCASA
jgi:hypothetical protein